MTGPCSVSDAVYSPPEIDNRSPLLPVLAAVVIFAMLFSAFYQTAESRDALEHIEEQATRIERLDNLLMDTLRADSAARGFLLTGSHRELESWSTAREALDLQLDRMTASEHGALPAEQRLAKLTGQYRALLQKRVERRTSGGGNRLLDRDRSAAALASVVDTAIRLQRDLNDQNRGLYQQAYRSQALAAWTVFGAGAATLALWMLLSMKKQVRLRAELAGAMAERATTLEAEVERRTDELRRLATQLTRVSEEEKHKLARELHDELGASLTAAKMDASWLQRNCASLPDPQACDKAARLLASLDHAITMKRRVTSDLMPPLLKELGLFEALMSLIEDLDADGNIDTSLELPDQQPCLDEAQSLALFRIAQEAITNVRKYADAQHLAIRIWYEREILAMRISDDGKGFAPEYTDDNSFGIVCMKHRCQLIGGSFMLTSAPGAGTEINVRIPLPDCGATSR
ncbi:MAG: histidine kinase [Thiogranum sp.]|nr:histidine kinase [Thiogranum sp.]